MASTIPKTMRAVVFEQFGEPDQVVQIRDDLPVPVLGPSQVLVKVHSASVNPADWKIVKGITKSIHDPKPSAASPAQLGFDLSGVVVRVAPSLATKFKPGDQVYGMASFATVGTFAEYFVADERLLATKPDTLSHDQAAAFPLVTLTSHQALYDHGRLKRGERVLILGGSGGTGSIAIQLAHNMGAHVTTTCSGHNMDYVKSLGADEVVDYTKQELVDVVEPHSFDLVVGCVTSSPSEIARVLRHESGRFVNLVATPAFESPEKLDFKYMFMLTEPRGDQLDEMREFIDDQILKLHVAETFKMDQIHHALVQNMEGHVRGKLVVQVAPEDHTRE